MISIETGIIIGITIYIVCFFITNAWLTACASLLRAKSETGIESPGSRVFMSTVWPLTWIIYLIVHIHTHLTIFFIDHLGVKDDGNDKSDK